MPASMNLVEPVPRQGPRILFIACGALAHELMALIRGNGWRECQVKCLPADLHNRPERIPERVEALLVKYAPQFDQLFVAYGDCGTAGKLDAVLERFGAQRIRGAHCYEFFAGSSDFSQLMQQEPGTFFLTDFLARHFDRLVVTGLGLAKHPELAPLYFGHYRKLTYLAQTENASLQARARRAAKSLGLSYEYRFCGYGELRSAIVDFVQATPGARETLMHTGAVSQHASHAPA